MKKGKFIVITGGDGVGKTTCLKLLELKLKNELGDRVIFAKEPGGTEVGQKIREILLTKNDTGMDLKTEMLLFAASRAQQIYQKIKPSLEQGKHVLCDRFVESSFAYQVRGSIRPDLEKTFHAVDNITDGAKPDLYIVLDLDPQVANDRVVERKESNRFDLLGKDYHSRVRRGIIEYVSDKTHVIVDASLSKEQVAEQVYRIVKTCLSN